MDTKFWGPDGWRLLHTLAYQYTLERRHHYERFYTLLKDILPCRYCRDSYKEFLEELPIKPYLESRALLRLWVYRIHNKVNKKLRQQHLLDSSNPALSLVDATYSSLAKDANATLGWDFIYSIVFNYTPKTHNLAIYYKWFYSLAKIYKPFSSLDVNAIAHFLPTEEKQNPRGNDSMRRWFYEFQKSRVHNCSSYLETCARYESVAVPSCRNDKKPIPSSRVTCRLAKN